MNTMSPVAMITESDPQQIKTVFDSQQATAIRWRESVAEQRITRLKRLREAVEHSASIIRHTNTKRFITGDPP